MRRVISVAGLPITIEAEGAARWAAVDALFGQCPSARRPAGPMTVRFIGRPPPVPERGPDVAFSDVDLWYTAAGVVTRHHDGIAVARDGDCIVAGGRGDNPGTAKAFRRSVQHVLADALAGHDRFALHGAVVVGGAGAIVVLGDTGAGKSTLAVSALRLGWSVVTDDIAWVSAAADSIAVSGFPKPLHAPPEIVDGLPVDAVRVEGDPRERFVLSGGLTADDVARPVLGIVLVRHGAAAAALAPFPTGPRLLTMVMRSYPLQGSPDRVRQFFPLAARLSHAPVALLEHAADPRARVAEAAALLDEAAARFTTA